MKCCWILAVLAATCGHTQQTLYPVAKNGLWGLVSGDNKCVLAPVFDYVQFEPKANKFVYYRNGKKGLISSAGDVLCEPDYDDIAFFDTAYCGYKRNALWGLYRDERVILPEQYTTIRKIAKEVYFVASEKNARLFCSGNGNFLGVRVSNYTLENDLCIVTDSSGKFAVSIANFEVLCNDIDDIEKVGKNYIILHTTGESILFNCSSGKIVGPRAPTLRSLGSDGFLATTGNAHQIFFAETHSSFPAPEMDYLIREEFPVMVFSIDGMSGVWNLEKGHMVIEPLYDGIVDQGNHYLLYHDGLYGIASASGKVIMEPLYENIENYDNFLIADKFSRSGIFSLSGKEIEPCVYDEIRVYDNKVKCFNSHALLVVDFDESGNVTDRMKYTEFMTMTFAKERLPQQRSQNAQFGSPAAENGNADRFGWFRPNIEIPSGDTTKTVKGRWGLKDKAGSICIQPRFIHVVSDINSGLTKAFIYKPYYGDFNNGRVNYNFNTAMLDEKFVGMFNAEFMLVDHNEKKITGNTKFVSARFEEFNRHNQCLAFSKRPCLLNKEGAVVMDSVAWCGNYSENIMAVNQHGIISLKNSRIGSIESATEYLTSLGAMNWHQPNLYVHLSGGDWYFLTSSGRQLNKEPFDAVEPFLANRAIVCRKGKWGVVDSAMNEIIPLEFSSVERITRYNGTQSECFFKVSKANSQSYIYNKSSGHFDPTGLFALKNYSNGHWFMQNTQGGQWALVDTTLKPLTGFDFTHVGTFEDGFAWVVQMGRRSLIDENGNIILPWYKAKDVQYLGYGRYAVTEKTGTMVVLANGDTVVKANECEEVVSTSVNYVVYRNNSKKLFITDNEHSLKLPKDADLLSFSLDENLVLIQQGTKRRIFDVQLSKVISKDAAGAQELGQSSIVFKTNLQKLGVVDLYGDTLVKPLYSEILPLKNGWTFAKNEKRYIIINRSGKQLDTTEIFRFRPLGMHFLVQSKPGLGLLSDQAKWIIPPKYIKIEPYNAIFYKAEYASGRVDLYDLSGTLLIDTPYDDIRGIHPDGLIVHDTGFDYLWSGYLNPSLSFQRVIPVSAENYILTESRKYGVYSNDGLELVPVAYHKIDLSQAAFQVRFFNSFGFYNCDGSVIFDPVK